MIGIIAAAAAAGVAAVVGLAVRKPDEFTVRRAMRIATPPERVFPLIDDFHSWPQWSPWERLDPGMSRTHSGAARGPGAVYEWNGNRKVGEGRMEITESAAPRHVTVKLDFVRPFASSNVTEFTLEPDGDGTQVTWDMRGPNAFVSKVMGVFINMDRMIGNDFERGLASLKSLAEGR